MLEALLRTFFDIVDKPPAVKTDWKRVYDEMIVHTRGVYPEKLVEGFRPNEPKDIKKYRKNNYEPITQDAINRGLDSVNRTLSDSNGKIIPAEPIEDYIAEKRFNDTDQGGGEDSQTFKEYMYNDVLRGDIDDPNGYLVWIPFVTEEMRLKDPLATPASTEMEAEKVEVEPWLINSGRIVFNSQRIFAFTGATTWVFKDPSDSKKEKEAPYYWILTAHKIIRYIPFSSTTDNDPANAHDGFLYKEDLYYIIRKEDAGQLEKYVVPRILLGGHRTQNKDENKYYQSYFSGYVAFGNECIKAWSDNQAVRVMCNFPIKEEKGQACKECSGLGKINTDDGAVNCKTCNGQGIVARGPYSTFVKEKPTQGSDVDLAWLGTPALSYYSPDVSIIQESDKAWKSNLEMAEASVNILFSKLAQSGVAKEVDREGQKDMLAKIAANLASIQRKSLDIIQQYRIVNPSNWGVNIVIEPTNFKIKSAKDIIEEMESLSSLPSSFANNAAIELSRKLYNGDLVQIRITKILTVYDPFYAKSTQDISQIKASGQLTADDIPRHNYGNQIMQEVAMEEGENVFLEMSFVDITTKADAKLDIKIQSIVAAQESTTRNFVAEAAASALQ